MKKVLFVATVTQHINTFHIPYLKLFKEMGYEVSVGSNGNEKIEHCDKHYNLQFERSPFSLRNIKAYKELKRIINENKYDIIHCHTPVGGVLTRLAAKKTRKKGTRVIYTAHGFHFFKGAPKKNWLIFYPIEKYLAKYTDTIITMNEEDYELAKNKFDKRCFDIKHVCGVGIDKNKFSSKLSDNDKIKLRNSLGLNENDFVIIYPAELSKRKRQEWLINSLSELLKNNSNIHVLMPGIDSLNGNLQELSKKMQLENQLHFLGFRKDIPELLQISNLAVSAANQEGLPVNIMEAMFVGLPIVASNCRGNRDLISNSTNGYLIDLNDSIGFSKSVERIYKKNNTNFGNNSKEIIKKYLLDNVMIDMKNIYFNSISLIIPTCTDLNRGDQALVLETKKIIDNICPNNNCYMMSTGETIQCESFGLKKFSDILKHPSRYEKSKSRVNYNFIIKLRWGIVAMFDFIYTSLLLNKVTRYLITPFLSKETRKSLYLYKNAKYIFVKGGGFLHDYSGGIIGWYTMYYQTFHIKLAIKMKKNVYIMPNSYGPFNSKRTKKMVLNLLESCKFISARESISSNAITNTLGIDIPLYPDLAFFLDKSHNNEIINDLFKKYNINKEKDNLIAITVRPYRFYSYDDPDKKYYEYKKVFVDFIKYITELGYKVLLVVHTRAENNHENDEMCIDEILKMLGEYKNVYKIKDDRLNCYNLKELYGYCKCVIGTRFHSVIFALEQLIPCIAITYGGNKGDGIMKDLDLNEYAIKIGKLSYEKLLDRFEKMNKESSVIKEKIKNYCNNSLIEYKKLITSIVKDK